MDCPFAMQAICAYVLHSICNFALPRFVTGFVYTSLCYNSVFILSSLAALLPDSSHICPYRSYKFMNTLLSKKECTHHIFIVLVLKVL